ncbi:MAG: hypothetical protein ABIJ00_00170 [Candidatus Eisenbacteria bacterium]
MGSNMLRRITAAFILATVFTVALSWSTCSAEGDGKPVNSVQLIEQSSNYDGEDVIYRGEAVGDILNRGENAWVAVNDDHYSRSPLRINEEFKGGNSGIGVYGPRADLDEIHFLGSYTARGDIVEVRGTFYRSSVEHGGDTCIVARSIDVLERGHRLPESRMGSELLLAGALLVACLALTALIAARRRGRFSE